VDAEGMKEVAKIPSKEALLSMFCMVLNEPVAGFARAVKSIADKKPAEAAAPQLLLRQPINGGKIPWLKS
jgi:large subunit ribosomal protein L10